MRKTRGVLSLTVVGSLLCAFSSFAEVRTWVGAGEDAHWLTPGNWEAGEVPAAGDSLVFAGDLNLAPTNDLAAGTSFEGITFGAGAGAFSLFGNGLVLAGNLVNESDVAQHIGLPVAVSGVRTFNAAGGDIVLDGALSYAGSMTLVKQGAHELVITGSNAMATASDNGRIQLLNGTLRFAKNSFFTMGNTSGTRDIFVSGNAPNQKTKVVVEQGAYVSLGAFNIQVNGAHAGNSFDLLIDGGHFNLPGTDNSFGDQGNNQMSILITNGGSLTNSAGNFNAGTRSPLAITVDNGSFHVNSLQFGRGGAGSRPGGSTTLNLIEGSGYVVGAWELDSTQDPARVNVVNLGDGRIGKAVFNVGTVQRLETASKTILNFNGGEMQFRSNVTLPDTFFHELNIYEAGAFLHVASGANVLIATPLTTAPGVVADGGVTKRGPGMLSFNSAVCTFTGAIRVEGGTLRFSSQLPQQVPGLYVEAGQTLSFRGSYQQALQPSKVVFGNASSTAATVELDIAPNGTNPDTIHFPVDTTIGRLNVRLCERTDTGADIPFSGTGDFVLFTYAAAAPDVSLWTHGNCPPTLLSEFVVDRASKSIILRMTPNPDPTVNVNFEWANPSGGSWDIAGHWLDATVPPDAPSTWCRLWGVLSAPASVLLNREASIRGISFQGANAYTLTGAGPLKLATSFGNPGLVADTGTHTVATPVVLGQQTSFGATDASARLNVSGAISGTGPLVVDRAGTVSLTGANTFSGGLTLSSGTLEWTTPGAFGAGLFTFGGGTLLAPDLGPVATTVQPTWAVSAASTLNIAAGRIVGFHDLASFANVLFALPGEGTLALGGSASIGNDVGFRPRAGTIRFNSGADYHFRTGNRDNLYMQGLTASTPMRVEVLPGAKVTLGLRNLEGQSSILVDNGSLILPGSETTLSDNASGTMDIHVTNGGELRQTGANSFSIGVHGFTKITVDSNSRVEGSRVALGGNGFSGNTRQGSAEVNVSEGGVFEARDCFAWLSTGTASGRRADLNILNKGTAIIPATVRDNTSLGHGVATLVLDGGELVCSGLPTHVWGTPLLANYLAGLDHFILGENGGTINVREHDITITQPLQVPSAVTAPNRLFKSGTGALTLAGGIAAPIPLTVEQGLLAVGGTPAFTEMSVVNSSAIAISGTWAVSGALALNNAGIRWDGSHDAGTYTVATFGSFSGLSPFPPRILNQLPGRTYDWNVNGSDLELIIAGPSVEAQWADDVDGDWDTATNWDPQTVPNSNGLPPDNRHVARFADIFTASRTVSLDTPFVTVSGLFFDAQHAPVLQGNTLMLRSGGPGDTPGIQVTKGSPVIETRVNMPDETAVMLAGGTSLTFANEIAFGNALNVTGQGTLVMAGTNRTKAVNVTGATFALTGTSEQEANVTLNNATLMALDSLTATMPIDILPPIGATFAQADSTVVSYEGTLSGLLGSTLTRLGNGMLILPNLAHVSNVRLGSGTLSVTSTVAQTWGRLDTGVDGGITVLSHAGDITLLGPASGAARFVKTGPGTLTYNFPGAMTLAANTPATTENTLFNIGPNGEAPTAGPFTYNILDGTVVMGVPGQVITIPNTTMVGGRTTEDAGAETAGHLVINGGVVSMGTLNIARGNGTVVTAPTPLRSSVTVNGGDVTVGGTIVLGAVSGLAAWVGNAQPLLTVNAGNLTAQVLSISQGSGCISTAMINGGEVRLSNEVRVGENNASEGHLIVSGGLLSVQNNINLALTAGSTGTLHMAGGIVDVVNVTGNTAVNTHTRILFDGGLFRPRRGPLETVKEAQVLAGGMRIEVAEGLGYSLNIPFTDAGLTSDAGLTKTGQGYLNVRQPLVYKGATLVEEGELWLAITNALPDTTALFMRPGTLLHGPMLGVQTGMAVFNFDRMTLGAPFSTDPVRIRLFVSQHASDRFVVNEALVLGSAVELELYEVGTELPSPFTGTYTLFTYDNGGLPAPNVSNLSVANPLPGHTYHFAASNGEVTLTVTAVSPMASEVIWATGDGNWNTGASWQSGTVPLATPKVAIFPWQENPVTVTVDTAASIGGLLFRGNYTFEGANTLTLDTGASIIGASAIRAPLAVPDAAVTSVQPNGGRLTLGGDVTGTDAALSLDTAGQLRVENSTVAAAVNIRGDAANVLEIGNDTEIAGDVTLATGRIDALGNGTISGNVGLQFGQREIRPSSGCTLEVTGSVFGTGPLLVNGAGRVELAAPNAYAGGTTVQGNGTLALRAPATVGNGGITLGGGTTLATTGTDPVEIDNTITLPSGNVTLNTAAPLISMGDIIYSPATTIRNITKAGTNEFAFGGASSFLNTTTTGAGRLEMQDGFIRFLPGSRYSQIVAPTVRDQVRVNTAAGSTGGITVDPDAEVTLTSIMVRSSAIAAHSADFHLLVNGLLSFVGNEPICLGDQNGDRIFVEVNEGGVIHAVEDDSWTDIGTRSPVYWVVDGGIVSLGRAAFGRHNGTGSGRNGGGVTLVISNGLWEARTGFSWKSTDDANSASSVTLGCGEPLQGIFGVPPTARYHQGGTVTFNQNGGILRAFPAVTDGIVGNPDNFLNGINAWNVGPGGAAVDVPDAENAITITHAMELAPEHGGFTKLGTGTLTLSQGLAVTGAVTVADGTLKTDVTSTPDLHINADACLDVLGTTANFRDVSGAGSAVNGTVSVSGILCPGDEAGEIATFNVENFTFKANSTYRYDWSEEANDLIAISGTVSKEGPVTIDFGREEGALDAPTLPFSCVLGTYGSVSGSIGGGWRVRNLGLPSRIALNAVVTAQDGVLTLKITSGGTLIIVR